MIKFKLDPIKFNQTWPLKNWSPIAWSYLVLYLMPKTLQYHCIFSELRSAQINYEQFEQPMSRILREIKDTNHEKPSFLRCLRRKSFRLKCLMTWLLKIIFLCVYSKWDKHLKTQAVVFQIDKKFPDQFDAYSFIYHRRSRVLILEFKNFVHEVFKISELY